MVALIAVLTFAAVALVAFEAMRPKVDPLRRRIRVGDANPMQTVPSRLQGSLFQRVVVPAFRRLGGTLQRLLPTTWIRGVDHLLVMANQPWSLPGFLAVWLLAILVGVMLIAYISISTSAGATQVVGIGLLILSFAAFVPYGRVKSKARRRQREVVRALPDAMDLLVTSVEAGMGVDAAFALVADKSEGALSDAFALYLKQVGLGRPRREALLYVAERTGVAELIAIAHSVNQGEDLGTPISDVLRHQAEELRALRRQRAEIQAQKAPVKMTIPLALCFLPAIGAVVVVPSILNLLNFVGDLGGT